VVGVQCSVVSVLLVYVNRGQTPFDTLYFTIGNTAINLNFILKYKYISVIILHGILKDVLNKLI